MKRRPKLLVVDDGDRYIELAHALLRGYDYARRCDLEGPCWTCPVRPGCTLTHAHDAAETDEALTKHPDTDVVLLDVAFDIPEARLLPAPGTVARRRRLQGLAILAHLRQSRGALPVVLMTSREELALEDADEALAADELVTLAGADAFDARALSLLVERILARQHEAMEAGGYAFGASPAMAKLRQAALVLARTSLPVLLLGETGTGKSALAEHVIHPATGRTGPFVAVDLSAFPRDLVAAELFGTVRGAFSGAVERRGLFAEADGGTLLLDEIGNLPLEVQRMLLLTLQNRKITRLGESTPRPVDVKVIAATNADLEAEVARGTFRMDLYARLNPAARLTIPPLRERLEDLEELARGFVRKTFASGPDRALLAEYQQAARIEGPPRAQLTIGRPRETAREATDEVTFVLGHPALRLLRRHRWPGNVRELEMLMNNAVLFALADAVRAAEEGRTTTVDWSIPLSARMVRELLSGGWGREVARAITEDEADDEVPVAPRGTLHEVARDLERRLYERLFTHTGGSFEKMAETLLEDSSAEAARKVRLRFNQLGLSARMLRKIDFDSIN
jgi:DNA-binding NtrC family response regulator